MKNKILNIKIFTILLFLPCPPLLLSQNQEPFSISISQKIDDYIKSNMEGFQIPGLVVSVIKDGKTFFTKAYGYKDVESKTRMDNESIFHMASVSKTFTATAVMKLAEQGKINLNTPLIEYLPYFKLDDDRYKLITIKQMLSHTSGMPDDNDYNLDNPPTSDSVAELYVRNLAKVKMIGDPGASFNYSNMAYDVLANLVANVTGMTFEDFVKNELLIPLKMDNSDFLFSRIKKEKVTSSYVLNATADKGKYPYNREHAPSSCLSSNITDLNNWSITFLNYGKFGGIRLLDSTTVVSLFTPLVKIDDTQAMGLGWFIGNYKGERMIYHGGGDFGYRNFMMLDPGQSSAVIIASNFEATPNMDLTYGLMDILLGYSPPMLKKAEFWLFWNGTRTGRTTKPKPQRSRILKTK